MKRTRAVRTHQILAFVLWILSSGCWAVQRGGIRAGKVQEGKEPPLQLRQQQRRTAFAFNPRIVGGISARNGRYPYAQISLATDAGLHQCGGSLIAPDIILTAGHCHGFFSQIRVNIYNIKNELENYQIFKAERMHFHPNFDELWFRYDFLLLQLNGTVQGLQPVRINSDEGVPTPGDPLTVVGWGLTDPEDSTAYPDELKEVTVNYISNDSCEQTSSKGQRLYQGYIFNDMLCAREEGKDACSGDSGAPLIRRGSTPDHDVIIGVVSWGNGCATDYPGVYARISYQYQWIKDLVCAISKYPPATFRCPGNMNVINNHNNNNAGGNQPTVGAVPAPAPTNELRPQPQIQTIEPTMSMTTHEGYLPIKVEIQLDLRSKDTGWSLVSSAGDTIAEVEAGAYTTPYQLVEQVVYLPKSSQFVFIMRDAQGDGICCEFGGGWYQVGVVLTDDTIKPLVKGYGTFSLSSTNVFMTPQDNFPILSLGIGPPSQPLQDVLPPQGSIISNNNNSSSTHEPMTLADASYIHSSTAWQANHVGPSLILTSAISLMLCLLVAIR